MYIMKIALFTFALSCHSTGSKPQMTTRLDWC